MIDTADLAAFAREVRTTQLGLRAFHQSREGQSLFNLRSLEVLAQPAKSQFDLNPARG